MHYNSQINNCLIDPQSALQSVYVRPRKRSWFPGSQALAGPNQASTRRDLVAPWHFQAQYAHMFTYLNPSVREESIDPAACPGLTRRRDC